jgi:hypothetical protein
MYEHRTAYRHPGTGEVEGFIGTGSTKKQAESDAIEQIRRKVDHVASLGVYDHVYDKANLITSPSRLSPEELVEVQSDWESGLRY